MPVALDGVQARGFLSGTARKAAAGNLLGVRLVHVRHDLLKGGAVKPVAETVVHLMICARVSILAVISLIDIVLPSSLFKGCPGGWGLFPPDNGIITYFRTYIDRHSVYTYGNIFVYFIYWRK